MSYRNFVHYTVLYTEQRLCMLFRAEDILIQQLPDESAELKIRKILNSNVE